MPAAIEPGLTTVIVVTANSGSLALQCIDRVLASSALLELIVVDNASCDGQIEHIESRFGGDPRLRVLRNLNNIGFGPACNKAAKVANTPDVKMKKDGTPDKRYKAAKTLKKDGTPDKRYKANK